MANENLLYMICGNFVRARNHLMRLNDNRAKRCLRNLQRNTVRSTYRDNTQKYYTISGSREIGGSKNGAKLFNQKSQKFSIFKFYKFSKLNLFLKKLKFFNRVLWRARLENPKKKGSEGGVRQTLLFLFYSELV